jgi:hypothetical protein
VADLTPTQREVLRALADTAVPSLQVEDDPHGFWATSGSDVGTHAAMEEALALAPEVDQVGMAQLLDGLAMLGFQHQGRKTREGMLGTLMALAPEALIAVTTLRAGACMYAHSLVGEDGRNPFWPQYGYPGPQIAPPTDEPHIRPHVPTDGEVLEADVVIVGSGAGGGTIAGVLAKQGKKVVVLEAGRATSERDYRQLEAEASATMMYRGGFTVSADGHAAILAGATLGGGTTINWHNCVKPSAEVRREWAREWGLEDVDSPEFDRHLEAVLARMKANDQCSDLNGPHQRMAEGAKALGWSIHTAVRNVDPDTYDPVAAGYTQFGDPTGSKMGTLNTYLRDAYDAGAVIVVNAKATQVCVEEGRASGVAATWTEPDTGQTRNVTVRAKDVVVACGALETPALLLRSGIGGPAVGHNLYLHPSSGIFGVYAEEQQAFWGPPQAAVMDEFRDLGDGYGFLVEGSQYYPGVFASSSPPRRQAGQGGHEQARADGRLPVHPARPHGRHGHDRRGRRGGAQLRADRRARHRRLPQGPARDGQAARGRRRRGAVVRRDAARLEARRGRRRVVRRARPDPHRRGRAVHGLGPPDGQRPHGHRPGDRRSPADRRAARHPGVWIGDTSAFPTPSGANPMLTCMALAHRTAEQISGQRDETPIPAQAEKALDDAPAA